jgi:hypothetical protein
MSYAINGWSRRSSARERQRGISPGNMFIGYNAAGQKLTLEDQNAIALSNISTRKLEQI